MQRVFSLTSNAVLSFLLDPTTPLQNPWYIQAQLSTVKKPNVDLRVLNIPFFSLYLISAVACSFSNSHLYQHLKKNVWYLEETAAFQ